MLSRKVLSVLDELPKSAWRIKQSRDHYWLYVVGTKPIIIGNNATARQYDEINLGKVRRVVDAYKERTAT